MRSAIGPAALSCALAGCITAPAYVPPDGVERYKGSHLACMSLMYGVRDIHGPPSWNVYGWCMRQKGHPPKAAAAAPG